MSTNNFKLMDEQVRNKHPEAPSDIEYKVNSNIHNYTFFGKVVELFIPRIFDSLLNMIGGGSSKKNVRNSPTQRTKADLSSRGNAKSDQASERGDIVF